MVLKTSISVLKNDYLYITDEQQVDTFMGRSIFHSRSHPELVIYAVTAGGGYLVMGEQIRVLKAGEIAIIGPHQEHRWLKTLPDEESSQPLEILIMYFNHHAFCNLFEKVSAYNEIGKMIESSSMGLHILGDKCIGIIEQLRNLRTQKGFLKISTMLQLLHSIALGPFITILSKSSYHVDSKEIYYSDTFVRIIARVHREFLHPITLQEIANAAGLRKNHVCRLFKRRLATTFTRYRDELRVQHAMKLLKSTDQTIKYISYHCGYKSTAHFCYLFRLIIGSTPTEFRFHHQGERL